MNSKKYAKLLSVAASLTVLLSVFYTPLAFALPNAQAKSEYKYEKLDEKKFDIRNVVVKFKENTIVRESQGKLVSKTSADISNIQDLLNQKPEIKIKRKFDVIPEKTLDSETLKAEKKSGKNLVDLNSYYTFFLPESYTDEDAQKLVHDLKQLPEVETSYIQPIPQPAGGVDISPATPDYTANQGYLANSATGTYALYAHTLPGGKGENVKFIDVEADWTFTHEDLDNTVADLLFGQEYNDAGWTNHGTAVLGVVSAIENAYGVTGIAPLTDAKTVSAYMTGNYWDVSSAITNAAINASVGDVILLELQYTGPVDYVPVEYYDAEYNAILFATASGRVIIEAAGNGGQNLDNAAVYGNIFDRDVYDSGAIMVGAGCPPSYLSEGCTGPRDVLSFSNYGERLDVQGWGRNVMTLGYGTTFTGGGDVNQYYTATFSGTSSGSAVVAGVATALQSLAKEAGVTLTPLEMRELLVSTGTAQVANVKNIGPLPNLQAAHEAIYAIVPDFTADVVSGYEPLTVQFTDTSEYFLADTWEWDFGDTNTSTDPNPIHVYQNDGIYSVTLTVSNSETEESITKTDYIEVLPRFWNNWVQNGGKTSAPIAIQEFDGRLYFAIRGNSDPYNIYIRSTADGTFDGSDAGESWSAAGVNGKTSAEPELAVFNSRLYIAVRGNSGNVFTKSMGTDGNWDSTWNDNGGATGGAIAMDAYTPSTGPNAGIPLLYQAIRGYSTNYLYTRYTDDGVFDGSDAGETWFKIWGQSPNAPAIQSFSGTLVMSVRGNSGEIWNRYSTDGIFDDNPAFEIFNQNGGKTSVAPTLAVFDGELYQTIKGNSTSKIYWRSIAILTNWEDWTPWFEEGGETPSRVGMGTFTAINKLYQAVRGNSGDIYIRTNKE